MAAVVSQGQLSALSRASFNGGSSIQIADDYSATYAKIWRCHGSVRTVVDFLGRNIASLGLHMFERVDDSDRRRVTDHPLIVMLDQPNPWTTHYTFFDSLVRDLAIYERFLAIKVEAGDRTALIRIPPTMYEVKGANWMFAEAFEVRGTTGKVTYLREQVIYIDGYSPDGGLGGVSPIESLREILAEEYEAARMRAQTFRNGARTSGYLERPTGAPSWSKEARARFRAGWRSQYSGGGTEAGGTPILEDGMKFVSASQTAKDLQYIESRKLTREEVASAYFIPPPMVGLLDKATFSNIKEQHKNLYQDTLGPWLQRITQELVLQLFPDYGDMSGFYLEFNLEEKMRGSFEDQAAQLQASVGGPWMSRNEARAMRNMHAIEGGDDLITPLNVVTGAQASPQDSGTQNVGGQAMGLMPMRKFKAKSTEYEIKAPTEEEIPAEHADALAEVFAKFFARQRAVVLAVAKAKSSTGIKSATDGWDDSLWDDALEEDLLQQSLSVTGSVATAALKDLGIDPDLYSVDRTEAFLKKVSRRIAEQVNASTRKALDEAEADAEDDDAGYEAAEHVFDVAEESGAAQAGMTMAANVVGFAMVEASRQTQPTATKRWQVNSGNPRASHADMDGEVQSMDDDFSNGMKWPGSFSGDVDDVAGCQCSVVIIT